MSRENERLRDKLSPIIEPAAGNQRGMEVDLVAIPSWFGVHVSEDRVPVRQEEAVEVCVFGLWVGCDGANDPPGPLIGRPSASQRCSFTEVMVIFVVLTIVEEQHDVFAVRQAPQASSRLASFEAAEDRFTPSLSFVGRTRQVWAAELSA